MRRWAACVLLAGGLFTTTAHADGQWNMRLALGLGSSAVELAPALLLDTQLRADVLFGAPGDEHFRFGPTVALRSRTFQSFEPSAGVALLIPIIRGYPLVLSATAGYAWRDAKDNPDACGAVRGPIGEMTLEWGGRSYDYHDAYQPSLGLFVSARSHLDMPGRLEFSAGIVVDLEYIFVVPIRLLVTKLRGSPHNERISAGSDAAEGR